MATRDSLLELQNKISQTVLGQEAMIERLLIGLLANGNLLVEGLPGLAKTRAIKKLSKFLDAGLSRIQFTPDLLPSDITGSEIYYTSEGKGEFRIGRNQHVSVEQEESFGDDRGGALIAVHEGMIARNRESVGRGQSRCVGLTVRF